MQKNIGNNSTATKNSVFVVGSDVQKAE